MLQKENNIWNIEWTPLAGHETASVEAVSVYCYFNINFIYIFKCGTAVTTNPLENSHTTTAN